MEEIKEIKSKKVIDIYPTKVSRRILVFFSDLLVLFICSVFLFEIVVNPIGKLASNYVNKVSEADQYSRSRNEILYDNELLFYKEDDKYNFVSNLDYTSELFLKYYVFDEKTLQNEVIFHYFFTLKNKEVNYINELYLKYGSKYFNKDLYTEIGTLSFKEEYINLLSPYFIEGDELSEDGKNELYLFKENCFLNIYSEVIKDIIKNDLYGKNPNVTLSYNELSNKISEFDTYYRNLATINTYITFIISVGILYFLIPLLNKKGRTFSEIILKVERVNKPSLNYLNKRFVVVQGLFNMMNGLSILFLIPIISFGFSELFLLNLLFSVSFVSLIFVLIELIIMCFSKYVQSLKELATSSICCDTSTIDNYYKEKGYDI